MNEQIIALAKEAGMEVDDFLWLAYEADLVDFAALVAAPLEKENERLREALSGMLTHMGMDEDEWNKPTFDAARAALGETK